jgi:hypothetical protein
MSGGLRRNLADLACRALLAMLPPVMQSWGWAIRYETAAIPNDTRALLFALDSLFGLMPRAIASKLRHIFAWLIGNGAPSPGALTAANVSHEVVRRPRVMGVACATGAVLLGLSAMVVTGAPLRYLGANTGALVIGLTMLALLGRTTPLGQKWTSVAIMAMAGALLATALFGESVDDTARWVSLGRLSIQPSLILLPLTIVAFARGRDALATAGIIVAAAAMALQPDRAMAGMLAASLAVLLAMRPDRHIIAAFGASIASLVTTLTRADDLPAAPFVDQILSSSFDADAVAGAAVLGGLVLLLIPAILGWRSDPSNRETYAVFGAVWLAAIVASALGNHPTPIVGYGGSAIIGYALSLLALPTPAAESMAGSWKHVEADTTPLDRHLIVGQA